MKTTEKIFINFKQYSSLEFKKRGLRLLMDHDYCFKIKEYFSEWGLDEEVVFNTLINGCLKYIKKESVVRKDFPQEVYGLFLIKQNLMDGMKYQIIEETLFGKEYSEIFTINL